MGRLMGFAAMTPEQRLKYARLGGQASVASGRGHRFTVAEARVAAAKGGYVVSRDREHMRELGRRGAAARRRQSAAKTA